MNAIHDIILLAGGFDLLNRVEVQPPSQPMLLIERASDDCARVKLGDQIVFDFWAAGDSRRSLVCEHWTRGLDAIVRKRGYVEAAMQLFLTPA